MSQGIRANPRPNYTFYWLAGLLTAVLLFCAGGAVVAATPARPPNPVTITQTVVPPACGIAFGLADSRQATLDEIRLQGLTPEQAREYYGLGAPSGQIATLTAQYEAAANECLGGQR